MGLKIEDIEGTIAKEESYKLGVKTTAVVLTLKNGFEVIGTASCVNPAEYNEEIGKKFARDRALNKIWELEGYRSQCAVEGIPYL